MNPALGQSSAALPSALSLQTAAPVLVFLVVNRLFSLRWAVIAATIVSIKLVVDRRRQGLPLGRFMPLLTAAILVRGAIGALTGSETVYFGLGIASKYAAALVLVGSIIARKPLARLAAPYVIHVSTALRRHHAFNSTMSLITAVAAGYYVLSATLDVWLFRQNSVEGFVIWRFLANWPLSVAALVAIVGVAQVRLSEPAGGSILELIEQRLTPSASLQASADPAND